MSTSTDPKASSETVPGNSSKDVAVYGPYVPESVRENYRQMARDIARTEGSTPKAALAKLAKGFDEQHDRNPNDGWDHLAAWARDEGDPGDGSDPNAAAAAEARAVESAKRDPQAALQGSDAAVAAARETLEKREEPADLDGVVPNTGPAVGVKPSSDA